MGRGLLLLHTAYKWCELCCVSLGPLSGYPVMFCSVGQILSGYASDQRIRRVAICQKGTNREQNLWNSQSRTPVVFQNIQADDSLTVDVAVIDSGTESNLWWLKWIIWRKCDIQKKNTTFIYRTWWTKYSWPPFINVISFRPSTAVRRRIKGYLC